MFDVAISQFIPVSEIQNVSMVVGQTFPMVLCVVRIVNNFSSVHRRGGGSVKEMQVWPKRSWCRIIVRSG